MCCCVHRAAAPQNTQQHLNEMLCEKCHDKNYSYVPNIYEYYGHFMLKWQRNIRISPQK